MAKFFLFLVIQEATLKFLEIMDFLFFILIILGVLYSPIFTVGILMFFLGMPITGVIVLIISIIKKYIDNIPTTPDKDQYYE